MNIEIARKKIYPFYIYIYISIAILIQLLQNIIWSRPLKNPFTVQDKAHSGF